MAQQEPEFAAAGNETEKIDVRLSYGIVKLFSEGLYASPHKAIEELVANAFDAGARKVGVLVPADLHQQGATIAVIDDGEGMNVEGLKQHWLIGKSLKRALTALPLKRSQIGKFGIGKLATYVLANRLTHISKRGGKYYSTSMNFRTVDERGEDEIEVKAPIRIALRELTLEEAREALKPWTDASAFKKTGMMLFEAGGPKSWTFAILSDLKEKVHEINPGTLGWVLSTALPLRDDFSIFVNGTPLVPSKAGKGLLKKWIIGKDITELPRPSDKDVEASIDDALPADDPAKFGLLHPTLGRITGYAEAYKDILAGKSDGISRSSGFFVYVRGRLINVLNGHFGIPADELRHGTFGRMRVVVHIEGLDPFLQSDRERVREGPVLVDAQNLLRSIFNFVRPEIDKADLGEAPGAQLARKLAGSPNSIARRPIIELARAAMDGKAKTKYLALPTATTPEQREEIVAVLERRAETPDQFVGGLDFVYDATNDDGIAVYDVIASRLRVNGLHPFVGAFFDEFTNKSSRLPLEIFAMAEVLLESQLHQVGVGADEIDAVMSSRDQLLRNSAQESGRRTAAMIANALRAARNNEDQLEIEVVEAFRSLGFDATRISGRGKPDGVAMAHLSADGEGKPQKYSVSLEAKSKKKDGKTVKTDTVGVGRLVRHRTEYNCEHAIVVGPDFDHTPGKASALAKEIAADREQTKALGRPRTVTAIYVDDLARLVQLRPAKRVSLSRLRELFTKNSLPEECKAWIDEIEKEKVEVPPYKLIIDTIHQAQQQFEQAPVEYSALRTALAMGKPPYKLRSNDEVKELCKAMSNMASNEIAANDRTVELNQSPANVLAAIQAATHAEEE